MPAQTTNLFLLEDLEDVGRTSELADSDLAALHAVADWIKTFVVKPHKDLGRAGPVCPFVPGALERKALWLAPERIADRDVPDVVELLITGAIKWGDAIFPSVQVRAASAHTLWPPP